jgi:hypothetical protein
VSTGRWVLQQKRLDLAGVHAALLPTGKVLFFSYFAPEENNVNLSKWQLWQEGQGPLSLASFDLGRNLFCSGHCFLPDGRLLVAAGQSWNFATQGIWGADHDIHTFDPTTESWSRYQDMPAARYYPTCVTLPDGIAFICGGAWTRVPSNQSNHEYETFDWRSNTKSVPVIFDPGHISELYPFLQVLPDGSPKGKLFVFSKNEARLFDLASGTWGPNSFKTASPGSRNYPHQGSCVLLPLLPGRPQQVRVMVIGGQARDSEATNTVEIFEFDRTNPANSRWRRPLGGHMARERFMSDAVLLPDQTVLVVNGAGSGAADQSHDPVRETELFDTRTETWKTLAPINRNRMYHSTAILLRSGRVLVAGNTEHWNPENPVEDKTVEVFTPPYLQRGPRPRIAEAPSQFAYGQQFGIRSPDAGRIRSVALMRAGSVTHTNNMDQRYVGLAIEGRGTDRLTVRAPRDGTYAPPGHYLLFIVDDDRVPSIASMVRINPLAPPVGKTLVVDRWIPVRESDADVDTGVDVGPGDEYAFVEATGSIWAGVWGTGRNGPQGWDNIDHDPKFPLHEGAYAHPFSLLGRFAGLPYFYIGTGRVRERYPDTQMRRLQLRINDDVPGNGNGEFSCHVQVWSDRPR